MKTRIQFQNNWATYSPGEQVIGDVILKFSQRSTINSLSISVKGESQVGWSETIQRAMEMSPVLDGRGRGRGRAKRLESVKFSGNESYFQTNISIFTIPVELPRGESSFPFVILLPTALPCSFTSTFGSIQYTVSVKITRPRKPEETFESNFLVVTPLDLNTVNEAKVGISLLSDKTVRSGFYMKEGNICIQVLSPVSGYVCGEEIPLLLRIENISKKTIYKIDCMIKKTIIYKATYPSVKQKEEEIIIGDKLRIGKMDPNESKNYSEVLKVPQTQPSNLNYCNIIHLSYSLEVQVDIEGLFNRAVKLSAPITIGTVPIRERLANPTVMPSTIYTTGTAPNEWSSASFKSAHMPSRPAPPTPTQLPFASGTLPRPAPPVPNPVTYTPPISSVNRGQSFSSVTDYNPYPGSWQPETTRAATSSLDDAPPTYEESVALYGPPTEFNLPASSTSLYPRLNGTAVPSESFDKSLY